MEAGLIVVVVIAVLALAVAILYLIYRDIRRNRRARLAAEDTTRLAAEADEIAPLPFIEEEPEDVLRRDTERRRHSTSRIFLAACDFSEPEEVDDLITDIRLTRLHIQNLTARKREKEAIISLLDASGKARKKRETLEEELSRENP